jgi:hypothetical protein
MSEVLGTCDARLRPLRDAAEQLDTGNELSAWQTRLTSRRRIRSPRLSTG